MNTNQSDPPVTGGSDDTTANDSETIWSVLVREEKNMTLLYIVGYSVFIAELLAGLSHTQNPIWFLILGLVVLHHIHSVGLTYLRIRRYPSNPEKGLDEPLGSSFEIAYRRVQFILVIAFFFLMGLLL